MADKSRVVAIGGPSNLKQAEGTLKSVSNLSPSLPSARRLDSKGSSHTARIAGSYSKLAGDCNWTGNTNYSSDGNHSIAIYSSRKKERAYSAEVRRQRKSEQVRRWPTAVERVTPKAEYGNFQNSTTIFLAVECYLLRGRAQKALMVEIIRRSCVKYHSSCVCSLRFSSY